MNIGNQNSKLKKKTYTE